MTPPLSHNMTKLPRAWSQGDRTALDELLPLVYRELHQQAQRFMRAQSPGHTLKATGLVHEAYLRLMDREGVEWQSRARFFGVAGGRQLTLGAADEGTGAEPAVDVLALDEALTRLAELDCA